MDTKVGWGPRRRAWGKESRRLRGLCRPRGTQVPAYPHRGRTQGVKAKWRHSGSAASLLLQWLRIHLTVKGHGFDPWSGKIPHAAQLLSPGATTPEMRALGPLFPDKSSPAARNGDPAEPQRKKETQQAALPLGTPVSPF